MIAFTATSALALAKRGLRLLARHPWPVLCLALALVTWRQHHSAQSWKSRAVSEAASHRRTKTDYAAAQAEASRSAEAARRATEERSTQLAKEADDAHEQADLWRARARHFADLGGLRANGAEAAHSDARPAAAPSADHAAPGPDRTGGAAVTLTRADFETLSANTERLLRVHQWGEALIAEGLAVRGEEP
ncbi:hypothetical protein HT136_04605 [Novosphingobium profundi]|uniref:hypothetical protein n=1 Tax=Novosphingobium profundi TaxID=1774954 RepID=UPI001BD929A3|nr:hypothetical protein [Novosphingobium profundi]MBT0667643.1 hypothetical protein [Novosphingobium profundi]